MIGAAGVERRLVIFVPVIKQREATQHRDQDGNDHVSRYGRGAGGPGQAMRRLTTAPDIVVEDPN